MDKQALGKLIEEVEKEDRSGDNRYSHAVQVLTPISLLEKMDAMVDKDRRLTRPVIYRRAIRLYLKMLKMSEKKGPDKK